MNIVMSLNIALALGPEEKMIGRLAAAGFTGLDFNHCDLGDRINWHDDAAVDRLIEPWLAASVEHRIPFLQGHGPMFMMFSDSAAEKAKAATAAPSIKAAGKLGVKWMVFHPDIFHGAWDSAHRKVVRDANVEFFRSLLPVCEKSGCGIAIENLIDTHGRRGSRQVPRMYGGVPEELCELIDAINHPLVGACWDTGHAHVNGLQQRQAIAALGKRLKALHVQDNDGSVDAHMLPFTTTRCVNWAEFRAGLRDVGYEGPFTYEVRNGLDGVPDAFLDETLAYAVRVARHIINL